MRASVANVGLRLSSQQLVGFGVAVIAGVIMARILPYMYPVLSPILDAVFGAKATTSRDNFNAFMMTALTFLTSFVIAYRVFKKPRRS